MSKKRDLTLSDIENLKHTVRCMAIEAVKNGKSFKKTYRALNKEMRRLNGFKVNKAVIPNHSIRQSTHARLNLDASAQ